MTSNSRTTASVLWMVYAIAFNLLALVHGFVQHHPSWFIHSTSFCSGKEVRYVPPPLHQHRSTLRLASLHAAPRPQHDEDQQQPQPYSSTRAASTTPSTPTAASHDEDDDSSSSLIQVVVVQGQDDPRVVDVAAFRHHLINPEMMVQAAQAKRDAWDVSRDIVEALVIGYAMAGPFGAVLEYSNTQNIPDAIFSYVISGTAVAVTMSVANILERNVLHVPTVEEATHQILEDYEEGVLRGQDIVFAALWNNPETSSSSASASFPFNSTHGVVGCVDVEWRSSPRSPQGVPTIPGLPSHLHLQNMLVHDSVQPRGIEMALLSEIQNYAKTQTDAQMLTLEVHDLDTDAIRLYLQAGFKQMKNPNSLSGLRFMKKDLN